MAVLLKEIRIPGPIVLVDPVTQIPLRLPSGQPRPPLTFWDFCLNLVGRYRSLKGYLLEGQAKNPPVLRLVPELWNSLKSFASNPFYVIPVGEHGWERVAGIQDLDSNLIPQVQPFLDAILNAQGKVF